MQQFAFISNLITTITIFAQLHERPVCIAHYKTKMISELLPSVKLWRCLNKTVIIKLWTAKICWGSFHNQFMRSLLKSCENSRSNLDPNNPTRSQFCMSWQWRYVQNDGSFLGHYFPCKNNTYSIQDLDYELINCFVVWVSLVCFLCLYESLPLRPVRWINQCAGMRVIK